MTTALEVRPDPAVVEEGQPARGWPRWIATAAIATVVLIGVVLRLRSTPPLWLDEAQSVAIARLPIPDLFQALREDGAPPLYYLLLQGWIGIFGTSEYAVRALSGLISIATLPIFWLAGRRLLGSRQAGLITLVLAASNPWLIRYASETRMYSLVILLSLLVVLAARRVWASPTVGAGALLAGACALLLYTHYWGLFLAAGVGLLGLVKVATGQRRAGAVTVLALAGAGVLFLPWLPSFLFQTAHTGTPWGDRPYPSVFLPLLVEWSSAGFRAVSWTALLLLPLLLLGYGGVRRPGDTVALDLRGQPATRWLAWLAAATLLLAYAAGTLTRSAYAGRYTAVVVALVLLLAAAGIMALPRVYTTWLTVLLAVCWLAAGWSVSQSARSQATEVAASLNAQAAPGDVVVYCPDQLGPGVSRLLRHPLRQLTFPTGADPARVNWVDYGKRNAAAAPAEFARSLVTRTPSTTTIWLVSADGYRTYADSCQVLLAELQLLRGPGRHVVATNWNFYERADLREWRG